MSVLSLTVEVEQHAPADKAIAQLAGLAARMQCQVIAPLRGITIIVGPNDNVRALMNKYEDANKQGRKLALVMS